MNENKFRDEFIKVLEGTGAFCFIVHGHAFQAAGWPDIQVYHKSWTGHIEFKFGRGTIKKIQTMTMNKLLNRGTKALVVRLQADTVSFETPDGHPMMEFEGWRAVDKTMGRFLLTTLGTASLEVSKNYDPPVC